MLQCRNSHARINAIDFIGIYEAFPSQQRLQKYPIVGNSKLFILNFHLFAEL